MKVIIPQDQVKFYPKGEHAESFLPGDFILVAGHSFWDTLIKLGQTLRHPDSRLNKWTHAALLINPNGELVEADGRRVRLTPLQKYVDHEYFLVKIQATNEDRHEAVDFALHCLDEKYGWITIVSVALSVLTGLKFSFGFDGQAICSGLVARSLERTTAIFPRDPAHITPCELASYFFSTT